jgi:hypothetical protein
MATKAARLLAELEASRERMLTIQAWHDLKASEGPMGLFYDNGLGRLRDEMLTEEGRFLSLANDFSLSIVDRSTRPEAPLRRRFDDMIEEFHEFRRVTSWTSRRFGPFP